MDIEMVLNQPVTLRTPNGAVRDEIGGATTVYATTTTTMYLEPKSGKEDMAGRNTPIGDWLGVGRKEVNFENWDQIVYGEHVFDIISPIRPYWNPITQALSHYEMDLQEVDADPADEPDSVSATAMPGTVGGVGG